MNLKFFFFLIIFFSKICSYDFYGKHYLASYKKCNSEALINVDLLIKIFKEAIHASGATILKYDYEVFPGDGLTIFFVLAESHASIHTYPEHNACFVDLFTCGSHCLPEHFEKILIEYLKPQDIKSEVYIRI